MVVVAAADGRERGGVKSRAKIPIARVGRAAPCASCVLWGLQFEAKANNMQYSCGPSDVQTDVQHLGLLQYGQAKGTGFIRTSFLSSFSSLPQLRPMVRCATPAPVVGLFGIPSIGLTD